MKTPITNYTYKINQLKKWLEDCPFGYEIIFNEQFESVLPVHFILDKEVKMVGIHKQIKDC